MRLFGRGRKSANFGEKIRVTYFLETDKQIRDLTVVRYVDDSPRAAIESSRDHVLSLAQGLLKRNQEEFVSWWVEDKDGKVVELHDEFEPPPRPTMWS